MRAFVAIKIPDRIIQLLCDFSAREKWDGARLVSKNSMHLTLVFIGNVADGDLPALTRCVDAVASRNAPFEIEVRGAGSFGAAGKLTVAFAGVARGYERCVGLHKDLAREFQGAGILKKDRIAYTPHITLARFANAGGGVAARVSKLSGIGFGAFDATGIALFKSELGVGGALHTELYSASLVG